MPAIDYEAFGLLIAEALARAIDRDIMNTCSLLPPKNETPAQRVLVNPRDEPRLLETLRDRLPQSVWVFKHRDLVQSASINGIPILTSWAVPDNTIWLFDGPRMVIMTFPQWTQKIHDPTKLLAG